MDASEYRSISVFGMIGAFTLVYWSGSFAAGLTFLALAAVIAESVKVIVRRLEKIRESVEK